MSWAQAKAYPVQQYAGLCWAYLGPPPAPALPGHPALAGGDGRRRITVYPVLDHGWMEQPPTLSDGRTGSLLLRMPIDDTHTWQVHVELISREGDAPVDPAGEGAEVIYLPADGLMSA